MTSATARSNALAKQREQDQKNKLYIEWKILLERGASKEEYLEIGGTESQLASFLWQHAS